MRPRGAAGPSWLLRRGHEDKGDPGHLPRDEEETCLEPANGQTQVGGKAGRAGRGQNQPERPWEAALTAVGRQTDRTD